MVAAFTSSNVHLRIGLSAAAVVGSILQQNVCDAFQPSSMVVQSFLQQHLHQQQHSSVSFVSSWTNSFFLVSDAAAADDVGGADVQAVLDNAASAIPQEAIDGGFGDILRNVAVAITAILFLFAGLTLVTASVIIPAAAKELEKECKELAPELWDEYTAKLQEGETMGNRPDLMQELGAKLLLEQKNRARQN